MNISYLELMMERSLQIKRKSVQSPPAKAGKKEACSCPTCGKPAESACIECDWCGIWEHWQCSGLSAEDLKVLCDLPSIEMFFCTVCHPEVILAFKFFNNNQENQNTVDNKLQLLEEKLEKTAEELNSHVSPGTRPGITDRSSNVIVYGIKESETGTERPDRQNVYFDNTMHTFSSANVPIRASSIKEFYRLGKFRRDQSRSRPILIKFLSVWCWSCLVKTQQFSCSDCH